MLLDLDKKKSTSSSAICRLVYAEKTGQVKKVDWNDVECTEERALRRLDLLSAVCHPLECVSSEGALWVGVTWLDDALNLASFLKTCCFRWKTGLHHGLLV